MRALFLVIDLALQLYIYLLVAAAVLSWLIAFNVVNMRNQFVAMVADFLYRITEPALRPIRNLMPNLGGIDISPVILIFIIIFIQLRHPALHPAQRSLIGDGGTAVGGDGGRHRPDGAADAQGRPRCHRRHRSGQRRPAGAQGARARGAERRRSQRRAGPADREGARRSAACRRIWSAGTPRASSA